MPSSSRIVQLNCLSIQSLEAGELDMTYKAGHSPQILPGICAKSPIRSPCRNGLLLVSQVLFLPGPEAERTVELSTPRYTWSPIVLARPRLWASSRET